MREDEKTIDNNKSLVPKWLRVDRPVETPLPGASPFKGLLLWGATAPQTPRFISGGSRSPDAPVGGLRHLNFRGGGGGGRGDSPHPGGEGVRDGGKQGDKG